MGRKSRYNCNSTECGWGIVIVIASHINLTLAVGILRCCGVLYPSWQNEFNSSAKETAVVASIMSSTHSFSGIAAGILTKWLGCRFSAMLGGVLVYLGVFSSFWVQSINQLFITAAIIGTGSGIGYTSALAVVAQYFTTHYKLANAISHSGVGTGFMVAPPLIQVFLDAYGWRGALLILSGTMANTVACGALYRPRRKTQRIEVESTLKDDDVGSLEDREHKIENIKTDETAYAVHAEAASISGNSDGSSRKGSDKANFISILTLELGLHLFVKSFRFSLLCLMNVQSSFSYVGFVLFIYLRSLSIGTAPSSAAFLLTLFGIGGLIGRLGNGLLISWKISTENVGAGCICVSGISLLIANADSYIYLGISSFLQGVASGACYSMFNILIRKCVGLRYFAIGHGLFGCFGAIGSLIGPVTAGWLLDITDSYDVVFYVLAGVYFFCALQMMLLPLLKRIEPGIDNEEN